MANSDSEPDFMDDAFLTQATELEDKEKRGRGGLTYGEMRLQALKQSEDKNMAGRIISKKQRERERIEEGLERNIIDEAEAEAEGVREGEREKRERDVNEKRDDTLHSQPTAAPNKALNMMKKMGFKPGQALGKRKADGDEESGDSGGDQKKAETEHANSTLNDAHATKKAHTATPTTQPIKPYFLQGRSGIGVQRVVSRKEISEAAAASQALNETQTDFRVRKTLEARSCKAEGVLKALRTTIRNADEESELKVDFNVFWINPFDIETYPSFLDSDEQPPALDNSTQAQAQVLKEQMQRDQLSTQEIDREDVTATTVPDLPASVDQEVVQQCRDFIRLDPITRLKFTHQYARDVHHYCIWCGCKYESEQDLNANCPGEDEDDH
ncbi:hypothetical protein E3P99_00226 [Wallemia hederae]|uniref:DUF4187 domain-containing protein n=1 Tax=Wallemia hederae TaxID=1540922 RepID=A0A4T0FWX9_9BASI|nr:hypothetical protein E3P99_00226 [Wallemia hederae]